MRNLWKSLLRGCAFDAVAEKPSDSGIDKEIVGRWLRESVFPARLEARESPGVGTYCSVVGNGVTGGVTLQGDKLVHAAVFATAQSSVIREA